MECESAGDTNCNWCTCYWLQSRWTGSVRNKRTSRDHPNNSIIKIGQYTKKNPGDLKTLGVTQTQEEKHQHTLVGKLSTE